MSLPLENLINELNSVNSQDQEKIIDNVSWLKQKCIGQKPADQSTDVFREIDEIRKQLYQKYGELPDCTEWIREDRER